MRSNAERAEEANFGQKWCGAASPTTNSQQKLAEIGVEQSPPSLRMTINRGRFGAMLLIQCLTAMGCRSLRLVDPEEDR